MCMYMCTCLCIGFGIVIGIPEGLQRLTKPFCVCLGALPLRPQQRQARVGANPNRFCPQQKPSQETVIGVAYTNVEIMGSVTSLSARQDLS